MEPRDGANDNIDHRTFNADAVITHGNRRLSQIVVDIMKIALPNMAGYLLNLVNEFTNTVFVGHSGDDAALAGLGLGNTMQNCFGLSVGFGVASALDTFVSQAYGAQQHELCCAYLQRSRILVTMQLVWMIPVLWYSEEWLVAIGQDVEVARNAAAYNQRALLGLFGVFQFEVQRKFLQNRCCTVAPAVICAICSLLHVGWCALFVSHFGLKSAGAGYANAITWTSEFLLINVYLFYVAPTMGLRRRSVLWLEKSGWREWTNFSKVAVPSTLQMCSEWWFWEICAIVVGYLGEIPLAAHTATLNFVALSFMPVIGMSTSASTLVGNALGAKEPDVAKRNLWASVGINLFLWTCLAAIMGFARNSIAAMYSNDRAVQGKMSVLLSIFAIVGFFDSTQNVMGGALRGLGKQGLAVGVYLFAFYGLMLPLGCLFAFTLKFGVEGLWSMMSSGTLVAMLAFGTYLCRIDWRQLAMEASDKMEKASLEVSTRECLMKNVESDRLADVHTDGRLGA